MSDYEEGGGWESMGPGSSGPLLPPGHRLNWVFQRRRTPDQFSSIVRMQATLAPRWIITRDHDTVPIDGIIPAMEGTRSANCTGLEDRTGWLRFRLRNSDRVLFEGMAERLTMGPKWGVTPSNPDIAAYRLEYQDPASGLWTEPGPPDLSMPTHPTRDS